MYYEAMLQKQYRLKKRSAFTATYRTGKTFHKDGITVFCGKIKTTDMPTKIGFVVSKTIHKRAVRRNRIKRLMRESLRLYIKSFDNSLETDYMSLVFVASTKLLDKDFKAIDTSMKKLLGIIKNA